jgi:uncharacterized membrane protein YqjE
MRPLPTFPDEFGAIFMAQVIALAILQVWRAGQQASREELGNRPRPRNDGIHLVFTALAIVLGLVLLIIWVAHPGVLQKFGGAESTVAPVAAFLIFLYVILVVGIRSSQQTSGQKSNPWIGGFTFFAAATLLLAAMVLPIFLLSETRISQKYQGWLALLIGLSVVLCWHYACNRRQYRKRFVALTSSELFPDNEN